MINWYNKVKFIYLILINTIFFILFNLLYVISTGILLSKKIYILNLIIIIFSKYLSYRLFQRWDKNRKIIVLIFINYSILLPLTMKILSLRGTIINFFSIIFLLWIYREFNDELLNYEEYKYKVKNGFIITILVGVVMNLMYSELFYNVIGFYFFIIILSIILLRESRNYEYKIRNSNSIKVNLFIGIFIMIFSIEFIYSKFIILLKVIKTLLDNILEKILYLISYIVFKPLEKVIQLIKSKASSKTIGNLNLKTVEQTNKVVDESLNNDIFKFFESPIIKLGLKIALLCIIIFFMYKLYTKIVHKTSKDYNIGEEEDIIEKIYMKKGKKSLPFSYRFSFNNNIKDKIIKLYGDFLKGAYKKGFFKRYMTATVLSNILKIHIDKNEELENISNIYNETKFSNNEISKKQLEKIKESYKIVNRELKKF
ncbi:hypothetical protein ACOAKC_08775 [Hathewaya histolytica]|uniref:hypothetical protein n=1 Tax=Hathewaya histolytica TaxID=1498 RepID=UPI003B6730B7